MVWLTERILCSAVRGHQSRPPVNRSFVRLETLESRDTPADFTVDTLADTPDALVGDGKALDANGKVSLRAVAEHTFNLGPFGKWGDQNQVKFHPDLFTPAGQQQLALGSTVTFKANTAIEGPGREELAIVKGGAVAFPLLTYTKDTHSRIESVTFENGNNVGGNGGAILNDGWLEIDNCLIRVCVAARGGAIFNGADSRLWVLYSDLLTNTAAGVGEGGAIYTSAGGGVTIRESRLAYNRAEKGGALASLSASTFLTSTNLVENSSAAQGGAIYMSDGYLGILWGAIDKNKAGSKGGGIHIASGKVEINELSLRDNEAGGHGGAIFATGGENDSLTVTNSEFSGNKVEAGMLGPNIAVQGKLTVSVPGCTGLWPGEPSEVP